MNNTALFDYYYSRRPTGARSVGQLPSNAAHMEHYPSLRESCRAQRAMRALMAGSHAFPPVQSIRPDVRPRA